MNVMTSTFIYGIVYDLHVIIHHHRWQHEFNVFFIEINPGNERYLCSKIGILPSKLKVHNFPPSIKNWWRLLRSGKNLNIILSWINPEWNWSDTFSCKTFTFIVAFLRYLLIASTHCFAVWSLYGFLGLFMKEKSINSVLMSPESPA